MTTGQRRIDALDIVRGVAIIGTLGTNIWIFTNPQGAAGFLGGMPGAGSVGGIVEVVLRTVANGKFLALLSIMFGVGLELQYQSARRRGKRWPGRYLWRAMLLLIEGTLHYILIFEFDVLMGYALVSMHVAFLVGRSDRVRRAWLIGAAALHLGLIGLLTLGMHDGAVDLSTGPGTGELYAQSGWFEQVRTRLDAAGVFRAEIVLIIPLSTVLFLAGIRLMRAGVFDNDARGAAIRARLMRFGLGIGVPLNVLTTCAGPEWFFVDRYVVPAIVAFGLLGAITAVAHRVGGEPGVLRRGLISTGRAAMSSYVFQNLVCSVLCYGWGLGLAAHLADARPWWVIVAFTGVVAMFMVLSGWWLRRFQRGPLELAMHWAYEAPGRSRHTVPV